MTSEFQALGCHPIALTVRIMSIQCLYINLNSSESVELVTPPNGELLKQKISIHNNWSEKIKLL